MFKIISTTKYRELMEASRDEARAYSTQIDSERRGFDLTIEKLTREREIIAENNKIAMERKGAEVDLLIQKATKKLADENKSLTIENENNKKEVLILTKAFENMGFDVKDMKEILNKLVDGIVSKNQIQLVK